jgi:hypothetical protein
MRTSPSTAASPLSHILLLFVLSLTAFPRAAAEIDVMTGTDCVDGHEHCPFWAATGECTSNRQYMHEHCRLSCNRCKYVRVQNQQEIVQFMKDKKEEINNERRRRRTRQQQEQEEEQQRTQKNIHEILATNDGNVAAAAASNDEL